VVSPARQGLRPAFQGKNIQARLSDFYFPASSYFAFDRIRDGGSGDQSVFRRWNCWRYSGIEQDDAHVGSTRRKRCVADMLKTIDGLSGLPPV